MLIIINGYKSNFVFVQSGVPKGTILGPPMILPGTDPEGWMGWLATNHEWPCNYVLRHAY